jgi:hypothetical protein
MWVELNHTKNGVSSSCWRRGVEPHEERRVGLVLAADEVGGGVAELLVTGLHPLLRERAGVLDPLGAVGVRPGPDDAPRSEPLPEVGEVLLGGVVVVLGLLLGVEVVEVAEELVEPVCRREELVPIPEVVLAELAGGVALGLQRGRDGRVLSAQAQVRTGHADLRQTGTVWVLARDERRSPGRAALFAVVVGEPGAFLGDAVDVARPVAHQAVAVAAEVGDPDVVAPDHQDVRTVGHVALLERGEL